MDLDTTNNAHLQTSGRICPMHYLAVGMRIECLTCTYATHAYGHGSPIGTCHMPYLAVCGRDDASPSVTKSSPNCRRLDARLCREPLLSPDCARYILVATVAASSRSHMAWIVMMLQALVDNTHHIVQSSLLCISFCTECTGWCHATVTLKL